MNKTHLQLLNPKLIQVRAYTEFKPVCYGHGEGYEPDLLKAIAKIMGLEIIFYPVHEFDNLWLTPKPPVIPADLAIGGMSPLPCRIAAGTLFTNMTTRFKQSLLIRREDYNTGRIVSYASFYNSLMKIGIVPGTSGEKFARMRASEHHLSTATIVAYPNETTLFDALLSCKIDAIARGELGNDYQVLQNDKLITIERKDYHEGLAIAVLNSNQALLLALNKLLDLVTHHGEICYETWCNARNTFNLSAAILLEHPPD